jgi:hypothetical protein
MEAVVAALLNIRVDSHGTESNAINRAICGRSRNQHLPKKADEQALALSKYNPHIEMIICVHCKKEISIRSDSSHNLHDHRCTHSDVKRNNGAKALVYARLFTQMDWCPTKDACNACAVIVPRSDDILKDLSLEEILLKPSKWKAERQRLVLSKLDLQKEKIICMHCLAEVTTPKIKTTNRFQLRHGCATNKNRSKKTGRFLTVLSNLYTVHPWCPDKINCKSCIQRVDRNDDNEDDANHISAAERHRQVMRNFNFAIRKIICIHCGKEQKRSPTRPAILYSHGCSSGKKRVQGRLFHKMSWCPDAECQQCFRIENR